MHFKKGQFGEVVANGNTSTIILKKIQLNGIPTIRNYWKNGNSKDNVAKNLILKSFISRKLYWAQQLNFRIFQKFFFYFESLRKSLFFEQVYGIFSNFKIVTNLWNHVGYTANNWALWIFFAFMECYSINWETGKSSSNLVIKKVLSCCRKPIFHKSFNLTT